MSPKKIISSVPENATPSADTPESGVAEVRSKTQERKEQILSLSREAVERCLHVQRETADREPGIKRFWQLNPHTQVAHMEEKPARLFYYLERAFSLPEDYREFTEKTSRARERELLPSIVLHPELFTDDFLINLGVCDRYNLHRRRISKKLEQKIEAIPRIKEAFTHTEHLPFGERWRTARVVSFNQPGEPWYGKYILFQERSTFYETPEGKRRKMLKIVPHVFDDIFSLARSQEKAIGAISDRSERVEDFKWRLDQLLLSWYNLLDDERKAKIEELRVELGKKQTFHELHALKGRLEKIDFSHTQIDTARIIGAWNDLERSWQEKSGKKGSIGEQVGTIRSMIRMEMNRFDMLYQQFLSILGSIDHTDLERSMKEYQDGEEKSIVLSPTVRDQFRTFLPVLREYTEFYGRQPFIGMPFSSIHHFIDYVYNVFKNHKEDDRIMVRTLFITTLFLKLNRVRIGLHDIEDRLKSAGVIFPISEKKYIMDRIEAFLTDLQIIHLLKDIPVGNSTNLKFIGYIQVLGGIKRALTEGDIEEALKQIDVITEGI